MRTPFLPLALALTALIPIPARAQSLFADAERAQLVAYWNAPGRYRIGLPPEAAKRGPWQARLTPEGSAWLWAHQRAIGVGKLPPTQVPTASGPQASLWETWIQAKVAYDQWAAQAAAEAANAPYRAADAAPAALPPPPPVPGPIPPDLRAAVGNPPPFAAAVAPRQHIITFEDGESCAYTDNVPMRPRYAYFRFAQGIVGYGRALKDMTDAELDPLFAAAGMTPAEARVAKAVSRLEGGFETVNTYDTGFVSVGFIQFVTLEDGRHSLCEVLAYEKANHAEDFARDFRRFGIDINPEGALTVVDPGTGAELSGAEAVRKVVDDKRLIAVFQRAGRHSLGFRCAQVCIAKARYWPAEDPLAVTVNGQKLTGKVSEVITSEAGLATLFDRKVNRGTLAPLADVIARVMQARRLTTLAEAAAYEREIVAAMKYRADFLADRSLSQPAAPLAPASLPAKSL